MSKSMKRVAAAIETAGLQTDTVVLADAARTATEAARACDCGLGQIAKSMIFEGQDSGALKLLIVSGAHDVDLSHAAEVLGEPLVRADPNRVRKETGFAIGGVAPIGHLIEIDTWFDGSLLQYDVVWGSAGAPHALFSVPPAELLSAIGAKVFQPN